MKSLNVAVIGVGHLGQHHARIFSSLPQSRLCYIVDTDEARGKKIAKKYRADFLSDYKDLPSGIDAVSIVVPTIFHHEIASFFIDQRKQGHCLSSRPY